MASTVGTHTTISLEPYANPRAAETEEAFDTATLSLGPLQVVVHSEAPLLTLQLQTIYSSADAPHATEDGGTPEPARHVYQVRKESTFRDGLATYSVARDGETWLRNCTEGVLLDSLEWSITDAARRMLPGYHLFHAGAVARNGHGILLPGPSGAGKSTTVAALALNGFEYCSDELALVGPDARLRPFPRIIALKLTGWQRIAQCFPDVVSDASWPSVPTNSNRYVRPPLCPDADRSARGFPVDFVLLPQHGPGNTPGLSPIPKSRALKELVEQSLDLQLWGTSGLDLLVELVRDAECYYLNCNDLTEAVALVENLTR